MTVIKSVAALFPLSLLLLAGCKDIQTCNDSSAKKAVLKIISENGIKNADKGTGELLQRILSDADLVDIKTTDSNDKLGAYECSANYAVKYKDKHGSEAVTYTLSHLEDSNTTEVRVFEKERSLFYGLQGAIQNEQAEAYKKLMSDYVAKRGSPFTNDIAGCINSLLLPYNQEHGNYTYKVDNLAEWDKACIAKADDDKKFVSDYVTKRGGNFIPERISCILDRNEKVGVFIKENIQLDESICTDTVTAAKEGHPLL